MANRELRALLTSFKIRDGWEELASHEMRRKWEASHWKTKKGKPTIYFDPSARHLTRAIVTIKCENGFRTTADAKVFVETHYFRTNGRRWCLSPAQVYAAEIRCELRDKFGLHFEDHELRYDTLTPEPFSIGLDLLPPPPDPL